MNGYSETHPVDVPMAIATEDTTQDIVVISPFEKTKEDLIAFVAGYSNLIVTEETLEEAKKARATLRDVRYNIQSTEKLNTDRLNKVKAKNWERSKELIGIVTPTEEKIDSGIQAIEKVKAELRLKKEREENERIQARVNNLLKFNYILDLYDAKIMPDDKYNELLSRVEAEYNAEQQRLADIKAEEERQRIAEQERIRLEREEFARQKAEFEKREADLKSLRDKELHEQQEREAKIKAEQDLKEAELKAERAKLDAERIAIKEEKFNQRKQIIIDSLGLHSNGMYFTHKVFNLRVAESVVRDLDDSAFSLFIEECRNTIESEKVALEKRITEEKAESERLAELKRQRQESLKPDKQKLFDLATRLMQVEFPELASDEAKVLLREVAEKITKLSEFIHDKAQQL